MGSADRVTPQQRRGFLVFATRSCPQVVAGTRFSARSSARALIKAIYEIASGYGFFL
jgi:hypothetical protein